MGAALSATLPRASPAEPARLAAGRTGRSRLTRSPAAKWERARSLGTWKWAGSARWPSSALSSAQPCASRSVPSLMTLPSGSLSADAPGAPSNTGRLTRRPRPAEPAGGGRPGIVAEPTGSVGRRARGHPRGERGSGGMVHREGLFGSSARPLEGYARPPVSPPS